VSSSSNTADTGNCKADILFVVDVSTTINDARFEVFKRMLLAVSENIIISPDHHRVALIRFWSFRAVDKWTIHDFDYYKVWPDWILTSSNLP
jgi:hypothetical protein